MFQRKPIRRRKPDDPDKAWSAEVCQEGVCRRCGRRGMMHAHHLIPRRYSRFRREPLNGIPLCFSCHVGAPDSAHRSPENFRKWVWQAEPRRMAELDTLCPEAYLRKGVE